MKIMVVQSLIVKTIHNIYNLNAIYHYHTSGLLLLVFNISITGFFPGFFKARLSSVIFPLLIYSVLISSLSLSSSLNDDSLDGSVSS